MRVPAFALLVLLVSPCALPVRGDAPATAQLLASLGSSGSWPTASGEPIATLPDGTAIVALDLAFPSLSTQAELRLDDASGATLLSLRGSAGQGWCLDACGPAPGTSPHRLVLTATPEGWRVAADDQLLGTGGVAGAVASVTLRGAAGLARDARAYTQGALIETSFAGSLGGWLFRGDVPGSSFQQGSRGLVFQEPLHANARSMLASPTPAGRWILGEELSFNSLDASGLALAAGLDASGRTVWRLGLSVAPIATSAPPVYHVTLREGTRVTPIMDVLGTPPGSAALWAKVTVVGEPAAGTLDVRLDRGDGAPLGHASVPVARLAQPMLAMADADLVPVVEPNGNVADGAGAVTYLGSFLASLAPGVEA